MWITIRPVWSVVKGCNHPSTTDRVYIYNVLLVFCKTPWWRSWVRPKHVAEQQYGINIHFNRVHSLVIYTVYTCYTYIYISQFSARVTIVFFFHLCIFTTAKKGEYQWFQASAVVKIRSLHFWDFTQHWLNQAWSLKMGPTGCPETSVTNDHSVLRKISE
jgi:hypothetical protein